MDAVAEGELVAPERGHDARPWSHELISFFVAGAQGIPKSGFQRDLATHEA